MFEVRDNRTEVLVAAKHAVIKTPELQPIRAADSRAAHPNNIEPADLIVPRGDGVGGEVFADPGTALHQGKGSNADKLMNKAISGNKSAITYLTMAPEHCPVRDNDVITNNCVMSEMAVGHEQIIRPDGRRFGCFV